MTQRTHASQSILQRGNGRRPKWVAAVGVVLLLLASGGAVAYAVAGTGTNLLGITNLLLGGANQASTTTSQSSASQSGRSSTTRDSSTAAPPEERSSQPSNKSQAQAQHKDDEGVHDFTPGPNSPAVTSPRENDYQCHPYDCYIIAYDGTDKVECIITSPPGMLATEEGRKEIANQECDDQFVRDMNDMEWNKKTNVPQQS